MWIKLLKNGKVGGCYFSFSNNKSGVLFHLSIRLGKIWHTGQICLVVCFIKKNEDFRDTDTLIYFYNSRNINNLRYADDTTLIAESEEELKAS